MPYNEPAEPEHQSPQEAEGGRAAGVPKQTRAGFMRAILSNWATVFAVTSALWFAAIQGVAWFAYGASPIEAARELAESKRLVCLHLDIAESLLDSGLVMEAREEFDSVAEIDEINIQARRGIIKTEIFEPITEDNYDPEAARIRLEELRKLDPRDPHVDMYLGHIVAGADPKQAIAHYQQAIRKAGARSTCDGTPRLGGIAEAHAAIGLAVLHRGIGQEALEEAARWFDEALELAKHDTRLLESRGYVAALGGNHGDAMTYAEQAIMLNSLDLDPYYTFTLSSLASNDIFGAKWAVSQLINLVETGKLDVPTNRGNWVFFTDRGPYYLLTDDQKAAYAFLHAALVSAVEGDDQRVEAMAARARTTMRVQSADADAVYSIFKFDLARLERAQPDYAARLDFLESALLK